MMRGTLDDSSAHYYRDDPQLLLAPMLIQDPVDGLLLFIHAAHCQVGEIEAGGASRISFTVMQPSPGGGRPGMALYYTPSPQTARDIAATLIASADRLEAAAAAAAEAAIAAARSKRP
jgi:hypothetical protein